MPGRKVNTEKNKPNLRHKIGNELRKLRKAKGYSQKTLADSMGISRSTISKIENGQFSLSIDYLERYLFNMGFTVEFIFEKALNPEISSRKLDLS